MLANPPALAKKALTALDHRIEAALSHSIERLWESHDHGLLDEPRAHLADTHRALVRAEHSVTFYRVLLHRLSSGEFPIDEHLVECIDRTVGQLEDAACVRDHVQDTVVAALESIEAAGRHKSPGESTDLSAADFAALLAITQGANLHEHLLTQRLSVATASGTRVSYSQLQRLETAGFVRRDTSHPVHAGQPITLTEAGRSHLAGPRPATLPSTAPASRAGAWPTSSHARR